jgi:hypothetical protein
VSSRGRLNFASLRFGARDGHPFDRQDIPRTEAQLFDAWAARVGLVSLAGCVGQVDADLLGIEAVGNAWADRNPERAKITYIARKERRRVSDLEAKELDDLANVVTERALEEFDQKRAFEKLQAYLVDSNELLEAARDRIYLEQKAAELL